MSKYLDFLEQVVENDVKVLQEKEASYGDSWKRRGGTGAYMVMIRKADRLENVMPKFGYDIFKAIESDTREEGILDDVRDLRRYLVLIEAEMLANQCIHNPKTAYQTSATPAGPRMVPSTEMESPFGYDPELDDK